MRLGCFGAAAGGDGHSSAEVTDASGMLWCALLEEMGHSSAEVTDASGMLWCGCWRRWAQFS